MPTEADTNEIELLRKDLPRMKRDVLGRLAEQGYKYLRREVPYKTGNLQQGVGPSTGGDRFDEAAGIQGDVATLTVTARSARRGPRSATLHLRSGKKKQITLRATDPRNYAADVALGRRAFRAKDAKALIIPVDTAPTDEDYIESGGQYFVVRKSAKALKGNPYHERAAKRLEAQAVGIAEAGIAHVLNNPR